MVSVPFRGIIFLNIIMSYVHLYLPCFRPLSGNYLPKRTLKRLRMILKKGFRPLSGNYLPKLYYGQSV